ncbi:unnamed protein product [Ectocarpus fasciculatus]
MARMGFLDKAEELDVMIEAERARLKKERDQQDQAVLDQKMNGLRMSHTRRSAAMNVAQEARITSLLEKCAAEIEDLKAKQKKEYDVLVGETATRATGGVSSCVCTDRFKCRHNKSASYNTRKPTKDVIRLRQNGQRLRASGRLAEADEVDNMAVAIEKLAEDQWRKRVEESILSSAWCGGKSRLEQMVERQQATLRALMSTHTEKLARLKQLDRLERRNLVSTLAAERKKVILYCRREATKRRTKDIAAGAKEARSMNAHKSDGMQNVSKNMFKDSDDSQSEIDSEDDRLEGWKPPTACGVDNSKALSSYEDIASGNVHKKLADGTFGAEEGGGDGGLKTSGSRAMDAYRMKQTGATATFDPTRGGAKVNMGGFAQKPPPGVPSGPGAGAKQSKAKKKESDSDDDSSEDEEDEDEEDEDESEESDSGGARKGVGAGAGAGGGAPPPRGPVPAALGGSAAASAGPRGPMANPFPAGGFGSPPNATPGPRPMTSPFPAAGFARPPGTTPGFPPVASPRPVANPFPAGGFGSPPSAAPGPRPMTSPFPAAGFAGPPGSAPTSSPIPARPAMASPFPTGGFGSPPNAAPGPRPMASPFPAAGFARPPGSAPGFPPIGNPTGVGLPPNGAPRPLGNPLASDPKDEDEEEGEEEEEDKEEEEDEEEKEEEEEGEEEEEEPNEANKGADTDDDNSGGPTGGGANEPSGGNSSENGDDADNDESQEEDEASDEGGGSDQSTSEEDNVAEPGEGQQPTTVSSLLPDNGASADMGATPVPPAQGSGLPNAADTSSESGGEGDDDADASQENAEILAEASAGTDGAPSSDECSRSDGEDKVVDGESDGDGSEDSEPPDEETEAAEGKATDEEAAVDTEEAGNLESDNDDGDDTPMPEAQGSEQPKATGMSESGDEADNDETQEEDEGNDDGGGSDKSTSEQDNDAESEEGQQPTTASSLLPDTGASAANTPSESGDDVDDDADASEENAEMVTQERAGSDGEASADECGRSDGESKVVDGDGDGDESEDSEPPDEETEAAEGTGTDETAGVGTEEAATRESDSDNGEDTPTPEPQGCGEPNATGISPRSGDEADNDESEEEAGVTGEDGGSDKSTIENDNDAESEEGQQPTTVSSRQPDTTGVSVANTPSESGDDDNDAEVDDDAVASEENAEVVTQERAGTDGAVSANECSLSDGEDEVVDGEGNGDGSEGTEPPDEETEAAEGRATDEEAAVGTEEAGTREIDDDEEDTPMPEEQGSGEPNATAVSSESGDADNDEAQEKAGVAGEDGESDQSTSEHDNDAESKEDQPVNASAGNTLSGGGDDVDDDAVRSEDNAEVVTQGPASTDGAASADECNRSDGEGKVVDGESDGDGSKDTEAPDEETEPAERTATDETAAVSAEEAGNRESDNDDAEDTPTPEVQEPGPPNATAISSESGDGADNDQAQDDNEDADEDGGSDKPTSEQDSNAESEGERPNPASSRHPDTGASATDTPSSGGDEADDDADASEENAEVPTEAPAGTDEAASADECNRSGSEDKVVDGESDDDGSEGTEPPDEETEPVEVKATDKTAAVGKEEACNRQSDDDDGEDMSAAQGSGPPNITAISSESGDGADDGQVEEVNEATDEGGGVDKSTSLQEHDAESEEGRPSSASSRQPDMGASAANIPSGGGDDVDNDAVAPEENLEVASQDPAGTDGAASSDECSRSDGEDNRGLGGPVSPGADDTEFATRSSDNPQTCAAPTSPPPTNAEGNTVTQQPDRSESVQEVVAEPAASSTEEATPTGTQGTPTPAVQELGHSIGTGALSENGKGIDDDEDDEGRDSDYVEAKSTVLSESREGRTEATGDHISDGLPNHELQEVGEARRGDGDEGTEPIDTESEPATTNPEDAGNRDGSDDEGSVGLHCGKGAGDANLSTEPGDSQEHEMADPTTQRGVTIEQTTEGSTAAVDVEDIHTALPSDSGSTFSAFAPSPAAPDSDKPQAASHGNCSIYQGKDWSVAAHAGSIDCTAISNGRAEDTGTTPAGARPTPPPNSPTGVCRPRSRNRACQTAWHETASTQTRWNIGAQA